MATKYKYSLVSIRNLFMLSSMDIATAVMNHHVPYMNRGKDESIDSYYTNSKGMQYFKALAMNKDANVGYVGVWVK
jgi:hypothetical protein